MKPVNNFALYSYASLCCCQAVSIQKQKKTLDIFNSRDGKIKIDSISWKMA
jgi:hypothetical protein